jgi:hypothetical protein
VIIFRKVVSCKRAAAGLETCRSPGATGRESAGSIMNYLILSELEGLGGQIA